MIEDLCRAFRGGVGLQIAVLLGFIRSCAFGITAGPALEVRHTMRALPTPSKPEACIHCCKPSRCRPVVDTHPKWGKEPVKAAPSRHDSGSLNLSGQRAARKLIGSAAWNALAIRLYQHDEFPLRHLHDTFGYIFTSKTG